MSRDPRDIVIRPVVSEKSYEQYDAGVDTFVVAPDANKIETKRAVEKLLGSTRSLGADVAATGSVWTYAAPLVHDPRKSAQ